LRGERPGKAAPVVTASRRKAPGEIVAFAGDEAASLRAIDTKAVRILTNPASGEEDAGAARLA